MHLGGTVAEGIRGCILLRKVSAAAAGTVGPPFPGTEKMAGEVGLWVDQQAPTQGLAQTVPVQALVGCKGRCPHSPGLAFWSFSLGYLLCVQATHPSGHRRPPPKTLLTGHAHPWPQPWGPLRAGAVSPHCRAGPSGSHPHLVRLWVSKETPEGIEGDMGWEISQGEVKKSRC